MKIRDLPLSAIASNEGFEIAQLLSEANEAVVYVDENWVVRYCNDVYLRGLGLPWQEVVGHIPSDYQPLFNRSIFYETIETCRIHRKPMATIGFSTALERWLMVRVFPAGNGMVMLANDASDTVVKQYQLAQQAIKDNLTGLPNKLALLQEMETRLKAEVPFSLAVLGLNRFQSINESQGYSQGDLALMEVASLLQSATLSEERLYRLNGDEFAFITGCDAAEMRSRVRQLLAQTRRPVYLNGEAFVLGASAGLVQAPAQADTAELLLKRAGLALRQAKRVNRDDAVAYDPSMEASTRVRFELEAELRHALESGQFVLMLQPKGSLSQGHVIGAEALIRWRHPVRGMVPPAAFLPLAQECGLMPSLDRWVLDGVLAQLAELKRLDLAVPVSINVSVDSLATLDLVEAVREALQRTGMEPSLLDIEIPEGALMHDVTTSARVLAGLNRLGVGISIDDFGTGYSSFAYLARFPVHTLKVDRSFVNDMTTSEASHKIVKGLIRLAHSLSLRVVAEGAETPEQMAMLQRMRCDEVQGYGYARPVPFDAFCDFVKAHRTPIGPSAFTI